MNELPSMNSDSLDLSVVTVVNLPSCYLVIKMNPAISYSGYF